MQLPDLFRQRADLVAHAVTLVGEIALATIEVERFVEWRRVFAAPRDGRLDLIELSADAPDVEHDATAYGLIHPRITDLVGPARHRLGLRGTETFERIRDALEGEFVG